MPVSIDIELPINKKAKFPASCVVCAADHPDSKIVLTDSAAGVLSSWFFHSNLWSAKVTVEAPACKHCASSYRWLRYFYILVLLLSIAAGIFLANWCVPPGWSRLLKKISTFAIVLPCLIPYVIWVIKNPLPFHIHADEKKVSYQFRNPDYAKGFAILNNVLKEEDRDDFAAH